VLVRTYLGYKQANW